MQTAWQVFLMVVEKKNFTRAAEALHMTQPAVSQQIKNLEKTLGVSLLERDNKQVQLNQAGEIVYQYGRQMLGLYTEMQTLLDDLQHKASGMLAIGASYTFGEYVLPHLVAHVAQTFPLITPKITIANTRRIANWVAEGELNIGIIDGEIEDERLVLEAFAQDELYIVGAAGHRLSGWDDVTPASLADETWIVREATSGTRAATQKVLTGLGVTPARQMEFGSTQIIKEAVAAGLGIALLSQYTLQRELTLGILQRLRLPNVSFERQFFFAVSKKQFRTKAVHVFIELLRNEGRIRELLRQVCTPDAK